LDHGPSPYIVRSEFDAARDQEPSALNMFVVALQGFFVLAVDAADGADGGHANMATHLFSALDGTSYAPLKRLLRPHLMTGEVC